MRYSVYKNLHNGKWSIREETTGLVVGHANSLVMVLPTTKVSQAGRARVLREKKKNVHAFIVGFVTSVEGFVPFRGRSLSLFQCNVDHIKYDTIERITYNPYKFDCFMCVDTMKPVPAVLQAAFINHVVTVGY